MAKKREIKHTSEGWVGPDHPVYAEPWSVSVGGPFKDSETRRRQRLVQALAENPDVVQPLFDAMREHIEAEAPLS